MSFNRCKNIHKFGNKYLPSAYKTQVEFRSHFSGGKVHLMVWEIQHVVEEAGEELGEKIWNVNSERWCLWKKTSSSSMPTKLKIQE